MLLLQELAMQYLFECVSLNCGRCKSVMEGEEKLRSHEKFSQILKSIKSLKR